MRWVEGILYSGFKDGSLSMINTASNKVERVIHFNGSLMAVDFMNQRIIVGLREGLIIECNATSDERVVLMESHYQGELWGLDTIQQTAITQGEDSQVKVWDLANKTCLFSSIVNAEAPK